MADNIQNSEMNDLATKLELLRIMECPVCQKIPFPPIFQCKRGHTICKHCKPKLRKCPTCRRSFSETRNYTVEQLVLASKHDCCYKEGGCPIELQGDLMENHIKSCSYRPFKCPWFGQSNCSTKLLTIALAKDHIHSVHTDDPSSEGPTKLVSHSMNFSLFTGEGSSLRMKKDKLWPPSPFELDGKVFFLHTFAINQTIWFNVLCVGSEKDAQEYLVKMICQPGQELETQWTAPVKSITKGEELSRTFNETKYNVLISSCTLNNLVQMAEIDMEELSYRFTMSYTVLKRESK